MDKKYEIIRKSSMNVRDLGRKAHYARMNMSLVDITLKLPRRDLYQIRALRDIPAWGVRAGDIGGYIENESNLSHKGDAWVKDEAQVYGDAKILGVSSVTRP